MHISDGILSTKILVSGAILASAGIALGLRKISSGKIISVALFSSAFFVASLIHLKVGTVSVHLVLSGLMGIALGITAIPAIFVALLLQAVLFQFGGLSVLGVNTFIIAVPAVIFGYMLRPFLKSEKATIRTAAAFLGGALPVFFSAWLVFILLTFSDPMYRVSAFSFVSVNLVLALIEGGITLVVVRFLLKVRPEILGLQNKDS